MTTGVEWIVEPERFEALRDEWRELLADSAADTLFLTWEWLFSWWNHHAGPAALRLLCLRQDGRLDAIAPLMRPARSFAGAMSLPALHLIGTGRAGSDYLDLIARRGREEAAAEAFSAKLHRARRTLVLPQVREEGSAAALLGRRLHARRWARTVWSTNVCPYIPLTGLTWTSYRASLSREHRYGLERKIRAIERRFSMRLERVDTETRRRAAMETLIRLHHLRWSPRGGSDAFCAPSFVSFHEEFSRVALRSGWLRLFLLHLDEVPVAALYGFAYRDVFYFYQSGFDPSCARLGVGVVLMAHAIRSAFDEGLREFDLLHGAEAYKFHWTRVSRPLVEYRFHPPGVLGWAAAFTARSRRAAKSFARRLLPQSAAARVPHAP